MTDAQLIWRGKTSLGFPPCLFTVNFEKLFCDFFPAALFPASNVMRRPPASDELNQKHNAKLEWIIIWLILIEVVVGLVSIAMSFLHPIHSDPR